MRNQNSNLLFSFTIVWSIANVTFCAQAGSTIENHRDKEYHLSEKHGPWMIMVATFHDIHEENRKKDGMSAEQAANELVYELRSKGIPAYTYSQGGKVESIDTIDRMGNKDKRVYASQRDMVCVLAGNYEKVDDPVAQKTLNYIKKLRPKYMADPKSGAVVRTAGGQKGPLAGAFMTINPKKNPNEVAQRRPDNETKYLNSGIDYALVNLKKKYSLKISTYTGKSAVPLGSSQFNGNEASFERSISKASTHYNLTRAGEDATQLTYALRHGSEGNSRIGHSGNGDDRLGPDRYDAYVYHDKFQSIVTVGGFDRLDDPRIKQYVDVFQAKYKPDESGMTGLLCETLILPGNGPKSPPIQTWAFDPVPELIEVPRIK